MAKEKSGEHWSWRKGEGAGKVGEDGRGSGGGHVDCASRDTPASTRQLLGSSRATVSLGRFVLIMFLTEKKMGEFEKGF